MEREQSIHRGSSELAEECSDTENRDGDGSERAFKDIYKRGKYRSDGSDSSEDDESYADGDGGDATIVTMEMAATPARCSQSWQHKWYQFR
mgnify:CR=1 FL=1